MNLLFLLLVWHALADFPLQGDFLANMKNPYLNRAQSLGRQDLMWPWCLGAHCLIQAGGVFMITNSLTLAGLEFSAHWGIDLLKCRGKITFGQDQLLHIGCKVLYVLILLVLK